MSRSSTGSIFFLLPFVFLHFIFLFVPFFFVEHTSRIDGQLSCLKRVPVPLIVISVFSLSLAHTHAHSLSLFLRWFRFSLARAANCFFLLTIQSTQQMRVYTIDTRSRCIYMFPRVHVVHVHACTRVQVVRLVSFALSNRNLFFVDTLLFVPSIFVLFLFIFFFLFCIAGERSSPVVIYTADLSITM